MGFALKRHWQLVSRDSFKNVGMVADVGPFFFIERSFSIIYPIKLLVHMFLCFHVIFVRSFTSYPTWNLGHVLSIRWPRRTLTK